MLAPRLGQAPQLDDAGKIFRQVDRDGSGSISYSEFTSWWAARQLATTGMQPDDNLLQEIRQIWAKYDVNGNGSLDTKEFSEVLGDVAFGDWREAFDVWSRKHHAT